MNLNLIPLLLLTAALMLLVGCGWSSQSEYSGAGWDHLSAFERHQANSPPDSDLITINYNVVTRNVDLIGAAGAVPPDAVVVVANLELGSVKILKADSKGAFEVTIDARPGTNILIKQDVLQNVVGHMMDRPLSEQVLAIIEGESMPVPGIIITIPHEKTSDGYPFAGGARVMDEGPPWLLEGTLSKISFDYGEASQIDGQIRITTNSQIPEGLSLGVSGQMIGDETGVQIGPYGNFVSRLLTPTGLPIELNLEHISFEIFEDCYIDDLIWHKEGNDQTANFSTRCQMKDEVPPGTYLMWLRLHVPERHWTYMMGIQQKKLLQFPLRFGDNNIRLAIITVGSPQPMRIATTLFADLLQGGTRGGAISREDVQSFAISPRTITQHNPVIPRLDAYGDPWMHQLEPYALLLGITDRRPPSIPWIAFNFSDSELQVTVDRPDGQSDVLGPASLASYGVHTPSAPDGRQISAGGNHIGEIPQLLGQRDVFKYSFPLDGDYVIRLAGHIYDTNGLRFEISGTYDLTVASSLDIETPLLPGTPFEVGNSMPIGLSIFPGVPADIKLTVTQVTDDNTVIRNEYTGTANQNGWWDGEGQSIPFDTPGEYRVEIEARYASDNGALWVGRMTYGGVIGTPEGPIIAHGRRGHDLAEEIPPPWGLGADLPSDGHLQFSFFTGDILWGMEGELNRFDGTVGSGPGESVNTTLSFQAVDTEHPLVARAMALVEGTNPRYEEFVRAGQIPLVTYLEQYGDENYEFKGIRPEDFSLLAYAYGTAQRPGVRVREVILGEDTSAYWRFADSYHLQSGNGFHEGDMPGDFKFLYGGTVIRDLEEKSGIFAIYGSGWVHARLDDPLGSRFMPPFQGNAGGPNGGPLFNVHGRDVDMFFLPLGVRPGSVLGVGDIFRMAGPIMPTLPSKVEYAVTAPDGAKRALKGRANAVGYYYDPSNDFELDQPGLWTVELAVTHDGMTSAGPVQEPYPTGGPLTPDGQTFTFVVIDNSAKSLVVTTDLSKVKPADWYGGQVDRGHNGILENVDGSIQRARFKAQMPEDWAGDTGHLTVTMPGIVLIDEQIKINGGVLEWELVGKEMNLIADNFDYKGGLADTITVTYYAEDISGQQAAGTIVIQGTRVPLARNGNATP
jgi:hypothetical protein